MPADHKLSVIVQDEQFQIQRFPFAMAKGWKLAIDGVPAATIREDSILFHREDHILRYIAAQTPPAWHPCDRCTDPMECGSWACCINPASHYNVRPTVEIDPKAAEIRIEVANDGVCIGFFCEGRTALLNLDALSAGAPVSSEGRKALAEWANDRRKQANAVPA